MAVADILKKLMQGFYARNPFVKELGIELAYIEEGSVTLAMAVKDSYHVNAYGVAHGGALMSLADTAMGASCLSLNKKVVTLEFNINCIKAVPHGKTVLAQGKILHNGKQTIVAECEIVDDNATLYAKARGSFYVLDKFTE